MKRIQMANLSAQYEGLKDQIDAAIQDIVSNSKFILGEAVSAFEAEIAEFCQAKYAVGVNSGTDAIMLSLAACGIGPGDEVITTPFTFVATTEVIAQLGAVPVYVDIDPVTYNLQEDAVEAAITPKTKAIVPVHLYGQMVNMDKLEAIASKHGLALIADGAQAIGATWNGRGVGAYGHAATLSFFPTKNLGAFGDGGMILTNDEDVYNKAKTLRFHGSGGAYSYDMIGWCSRLDGIQAAVLRVKLTKLAHWHKQRFENAMMYNQLLDGLGLGLPVARPEAGHVWHQYTIRSDRREELMAALAAEEIASAVYYPGALHLMPAYGYLGYKEGDLPEAELACRQVLSLPVYPELPDGAVERIAGVVRAYQTSFQKV